MRALTLIEREGVLQRISYADLGVADEPVLTGFAVSVSAGHFNAPRQGGKAQSDPRHPAYRRLQKVLEDEARRA